MSSPDAALDTDTEWRWRVPEGVATPGPPAARVGFEPIMDTRTEILVESSAVDRLFVTLRRHFWVVSVCAILGSAGLYALSYKLMPIYRATTILAPADLEKKGTSSNLSSALGSVSGFAALAGINFGGNDYATEEAMAVLKSQQFTQDFIREHDLMPVLFSSAWDSRAGNWRPDVKKIPTIGAGFRALDKVRKLTRDSKTGLITLRIDWKDPKVAADWTNQMVERLNDEMRERALRQADASMGYLQHEFANTVDVGTREAISRLMQDAIKQQMLARVTKEYALQVVDKALPADRDSPVRPIKILYGAGGFMLGVLVGLAIGRLLDRRLGSTAT